MSSAWIKKDGTIGKLALSSGVVTPVDDEPSRPVTIAPPMFSPSVSSEIKNAFDMYAAKANEAEEKNWTMRHQVERVEKIEDAVTEIRVEQAKASEVANNTFVLLTNVSAKMEGLSEKVAKLRSSSIKMRRAVEEVQRENHALWQTTRKHGERITAIESAKRDEEQRDVGKQQLITKGRAAVGIGFTVWTFIAAKLAALAGIFHK